MDASDNPVQVGRTPGNLARLVDRLYSDGFVVLHRLCSRHFGNELLETASIQRARVKDALGDRPIGIGSADGYIEIVQRSPGRWDVPLTPADFGVEVAALPWWPLVCAALGNCAEHSFSGVVSSEPGSPAQHWHSDSPHESADHRPPHALNVMVALHDTDMTMGPTEMARGSHRLTNHLACESLSVDELVYQNAAMSPERIARANATAVPERYATAMACGSCLVFDDRILHRGLANRSDRTRTMAYFSCRRRGYRGETHFESTRSVFRERAKPG